MKKRALSLTCAILILLSLIPTTALTVSADSGYVKRETSEIGVNFIEAFEGYYQYAYWDYEHYTIGYGTTCTKNQYPAGISEPFAHNLLKSVLPSYESGLNSFLKKNNIYVTQNQYDALVSFTYNFGTGVWSRDTTIAKYLKSGKYTKAQMAAAFGLWVNAGGQVLEGLVTRRAAEAELFNRAAYSAKDMNYVLYESVTVRSGSGTGYSSVGSLDRGTVINITQKKIIGSNTWGKINYGGNSNRWISLNNAKYGKYESSGTNLIKPVLYNVENVDGGVSLSWTKVPGATGYNLYKANGSGSYSLLKKITANSTVTYKDTTVSANGQYSYYINSYKSKKTSNNSANTSIYYVSPTSVKNSYRLANGIKITWSKKSGASGYYVMRRNDGDDTYTRIASVSSSVTSYSDTTAVGGIKYYYSVKVRTSNGVSGMKNNVSQMYMSAPKITLITNNKDSITLNWEKSVNADKYYVYRKVAGGSYSKIATVNNGSTTKYKDSKVNATKSYSYYIVSVGNGITSNNGTAESAKIYTPPVLKSVTNTTGGLKLTFEKATEAEKYNIYRKASGGKYSVVASVAGSTDSYIDQNLDSGKKYFYKIASVNGVCRSYMSNVKSSIFYGSTKIKQALALKSGMKISWKKVTGAVSYTVYKKESGKFVEKKTVTSTNYLDKTVKSKGSFYYYVVVNYSNGSGPKSATYKAYRLGTPKLKVKKSSGGLLLSWSKVKGATKYVIYRRAYNENSYSKYTTVKASSKLTFDNTTVLKGKKYSYYIKAVKKTSHSVKSNTVTRTK